MAKKIAVLVSGGGTNLQALIDAEKDALIEAKKQVALNEGAIADENVNLSEVAVEPVAAATKADKRAQRKAKKLAKKQTVEEEDIPVPHNKRGKISEKTLDSGTVK